MQCLLNCIPLKQKILSLKQIKDETTMLYSIIEFFIQVENRKKQKVIDSKKFMQSVKKHNSIIFF
jgi:hypothetical protein